MLKQMTEIDDETKIEYDYVVNGTAEKLSLSACLLEVMRIEVMRNCNFRNTSGEYFNRYKGTEWFITTKENGCTTVVMIDYPDCCPSEPFRMEAFISDDQLISSSNFSLDELAKFPVANVAEFVANLVYNEVRDELADSEKYFPLNSVSLGHALWKVPNYLAGYEKIKAICEKKAREEFDIDGQLHKRIRQVRDALNKCKVPKRIEQCAQILGV